MGQSSSKQEAVPGADAADASKSRTATAAVAAEAQQRQPDKLRDGPCAQIFKELDKCAGAKGITKHAVSWEKTIPMRQMGSRRHLPCS